MSAEEAEGNSGQDEGERGEEDVGGGDQSGAQGGEEVLAC